ncbi:hypothetical protein THAOC_18487 [Thalassiosira oceanica]|uniref:Uncharacterized protein n=1 Tax=Thalassiosira oceanica TaxID=159749 RepID=K0S4N2_THAOC|nr:hypothetical protein THAOC_18487 [Thalassiosira oceanica]|eukprot:EJK61078.1 hypothetical protein THAOC_18487 [Thalassiosira oceanica]
MEAARCKPPLRPGRTSGLSCRSGSRVGGAGGGSGGRAALPKAVANRGSDYAPARPSWPNPQGLPSILPSWLASSGLAALASEALFGLFALAVPTRAADERRGGDPATVLEARMPPGGVGHRDVFHKLVQDDENIVEGEGSDYLCLREIQSFRRVQKVVVEALVSEGEKQGEYQSGGGVHGDDEVSAGDDVYMSWHNGCGLALCHTMASALSASKRKRAAFLVHTEKHEITCETGAKTC